MPIDPKRLLSELSNMDEDLRNLLSRAEELKAKVEAARSNAVAEYVRNCK